jgi:hypothetical protein
MRNILFSLVLAAAGATGLALSSDAQAGGGRIYVDIGDVSFSYGRPYYRHSREPLYVVYEYGYPRYYRVAPAPVYYAPPPPRYVYRAPQYGWRHDRYRDWRHDRRDWRHDRWDRHDDDRRGRGRHRGRDRWDD